MIITPTISNSFLCKKFISVIGQKCSQSEIVGMVADTHLFMKSVQWPPFPTDIK